MNKARLYDDTLAYFVAGIKYKGQWYTENLATINDRKIGPGTIIIDSESNMRNIRQAAISEDISNRSIWRHLLADYLGMDPELPDIERIGFAELMLKTYLHSFSKFRHIIENFLRPCFSKFFLIVCQMYKLF